MITIGFGLAQEQKTSEKQKPTKTQTNQKKIDNKKTVYLH